MSDFDLVPDDMSKRELRREANLRAHKAGYRVTRDGKLAPLRTMAISGIGERKLNIWPRDAQGRLIDD